MRLHNIVLQRKEEKREGVREREKKKQHTRDNIFLMFISLEENVFKIETSKRIFLKIVFIRGKMLLESCSKFVNNCVSSDSFRPESLVELKMINLGNIPSLPTQVLPLCFSSIPPSLHASSASIHSRLFLARRAHFLQKWLAPACRQGDLTSVLQPSCSAGTNW